MKERSNEGAHGAGDPLRCFFDSVDSTALEEDDLEVPRKSPSSKVGGPSPRLINRFPTPSTDPGRKRSVVITVSEDAWVLSTPVGIASYLRCLVTKEDHVKMNEVDALCLFNEAQQALNRASVLHLETFLRYRDELSQLKAEVKELAEKREMYKLLNEQREGEVKNLRAELDTAKKEHAALVEQVNIFEVSDDGLCMVTNGQNSQVHQKLDRIDQLRAEMDEVKAMAEEWKSKIDRLASEKETAREQLASTEVQLRAVREKEEPRSQKIEDLQSQLGSAVAERDTLDKDLKIAKPAVEITRAAVAEMVAQYRADAESRREALEEVHARGFDLSAKIKNAKRLKAEAKKLADPEDEEGFEGSGESVDGKDPDDPGDETGSSKDQA
uniref:Uncharacterized protein n=1 Tax=Nicotiana tabacum TaxID=4097 RepID=A0A1S4DGF6_TOBAC|nr:PREDICTED: putative protein tag-278 [Nicotiana tabacum]